MSKLSLKVLLGAVLAFAVWCYVTYPRIGALTYEWGPKAEAALYGLQKSQVDVDGVLMTVYRSDSQGPALVMVHGFSADKNVWLRFAQHFTSGYQVIIPDMAGHGETGFDPTWSYTMPAQAARVSKLLTKLGIPKAHVIGNSMGGYIAAQFGHDYPQQTLSVGLVDAAGMPPQQSSGIELMLKRGDNPFLIDTREAFYRFYPMTMAQPPFAPNYVLDAVADQYIVHKSQLAQIFQDMTSSGYLTDKAKDIQAPVFILWGDQDRLLDVSSTKNWQAALPKAQVHVMKGIGHMPMLEKPSDSAELYQSFLNALPR